MIQTFKNVVLYKESILLFSVRNPYLAGYKGVEKADKMVQEQSFGTCSLHDDAYKMRL